MPDHPNGQLFDWISNGIGGSAMPAFNGRLRADQRWDLINYLRSATSHTHATPGATPPASPSATL